MEASNSDFTVDLAEKISDLDSAKFVVIIQLLDNSWFECRLPEGNQPLPLRGRDGRYHAEGELCVIGKGTMRDHFLCLQPVFKAIMGFKCIVLTPLPRYLWNRC
jgi:hypothetical protein